MQNLNSILLEGVVADDAIRYMENPGVAVYFHLRSVRVSKKSATSEVTESLDILVMAPDALAELWHNELSPGDGVRVIGQLAQDSQGAIYVHAAHIEKRPTRH